MLEQPQQDLFERPLAVTEAEAVLGRDAIELFISKLSDPTEVVARAGQPLADLARVSFGGEPALLVLVGASRAYARIRGLTAVCERRPPARDLRLAISTSLTRTGPTPAFVFARVSGADGVRVGASVGSGRVEIRPAHLGGGSFGHRSAVRSAPVPASLARELGPEPARARSMHVDLQVKEQALARAAPVKGRPGRYRPPRSLLALLKAL